MAHVSRLPGSHDRHKGRAGLIAGALLIAAAPAHARAAALEVGQRSAEPGECRALEILSATERGGATHMLQARGWTAGQAVPCIRTEPGRNVGSMGSICIDGPEPNTVECAEHIGRMGRLAGDPWNSVIAVVESPALPQPDIDADSGLVGTPILLKDNIETTELPTTAGSLALANNAPGRDAPLVTRLRAAGAVIVGKANLSEWANIRSTNSISGWSAVGGQARNPYDGERTPCGSSAGSAVAVAVGLVPAAIGTETDGSITCPASVNGVVGFKPTVGLVSRTHIVPISHSQDTAGPITTTVEDAAIVLSVIAGSDPLDPATVEADARKVDYRAALDANSLQGARIGVMRFLVSNYSAEAQAEFERALQALRDAGAELIEITEAPKDFRALGGWEIQVLLSELKHDLNAYLASTDPTQVPTRTLGEVIAFNDAEPREMVLFGQELFLRAEATTGLEDPVYVAARANSLRAAGPEGIDRMMADNTVIALVAPTNSRAWTNDPADDDNAQGSASRLAAIAGYPHLTVPMGFDRGMPVGLSFIGGKWDDARILSLGYAYEQRTHERRPPTLARR